MHSDSEGQMTATSTESLGTRQITSDPLVHAGIEVKAQGSPCARAAPANLTVGLTAVTHNPPGVTVRTQTPRTLSVHVLTSIFTPYSHHNGLRDMKSTSKPWQPMVLFIQQCTPTKIHLRTNIHIPPSPGLCWHT